MNSASGSLYCLLFIHSFVLAVVTVDKLFLCSPASGARENVSLLFISFAEWNGSRGVTRLTQRCIYIKQGGEREREREKERRKGIDWDDAFPSFFVQENNIIRCRSFFPRVT